MIKSKFTFFQVQSKGLFANAPKLTEPHFGDGPEILNPVDMAGAFGKFIVAVFDTIMLLIAEVHQAVITLEPIGVDDRLQIDFLPYNRHQSALRAIFNHLGIDLSAAFDQAEDNVFPLGAAAADPANPAGAEVAFVDLDFAGIKGTLLLAVLGDTYSNF